VGGLGLFWVTRPLPSLNSTYFPNVATKLALTIDYPVEINSTFAQSKQHLHNGSTENRTYDCLELMLTSLLFSLLGFISKSAQPEPFWALK
jgi:hypothetical protein